MNQSLFAVLSQFIPSFSADRIGHLKSIAIESTGTACAKLTVDGEYLRADGHSTSVRFVLEGCTSIRLPQIIDGVIEVGEIFDTPLVGWESAAFEVRSETHAFSCCYRCAYVLPAAQVENVHRER